LAWSCVISLEQSKLFSMAMMASGCTRTAGLVLPMRTVKFWKVDCWHVQAIVFSDCATHQAEAEGEVTERPPLLV